MLIPDSTVCTHYGTEKTYIRCKLGIIICPCGRFEKDTQKLASKPVSR